MLGDIERSAYRSDLAVHHPARRHDVCPGLGLGHPGPGVELDGGGVVDRTVAEAPDRLTT